MRKNPTKKPAPLIGLFMIGAVHTPLTHIPPKPLNFGSEVRLIETAPGVLSWASESDTDLISARQHDAGKCGGYMDLTDHPYSHEVVPPSIELMGRKPGQQEKVLGLLPNLSSQNLLQQVTTLSGFHSRRFDLPTGKDSMMWVKNQFLTYAGDRKDIEVQVFEHSWNQPSIIARIHGSGKNAKEKVIIGGHGDSINKGGRDQHAPGADDNASGTSTVLEVFRVLAQSNFKPNRTMEFMVYAAEEVGLKGSQAVSRFYRDQGHQVIGAMQFDMTAFPGPTSTLTFINDYVSPDLTLFTQKLVDEYVRVPWTVSECGYACSDHASWNKAGYPSTFPFETHHDDYNRKIHTTGDVIVNRLDFDHALKFAKIGLSFMIELSTDE